MGKMTAILFVCLGNICRSPLAEGLFRHHAAKAGMITRFMIDSAGTGGWHAGEAPDRRSIAVAAGHGVEIAYQKARKVRSDDFEHFDLILGMDRQNVMDLIKLRPKSAKAEVALYLDYALGAKKDVPDPFYGELPDFEGVYRLCDEASTALLTKLVG
jgi:protein-tyrosine phosphatase